MLGWRPEAQGPRPLESSPENRGRNLGWGWGGREGSSSPPGIQEDGEGMNGDQKTHFNQICSGIYSGETLEP